MFLLIRNMTDMLFRKVNFAFVVKQILLMFNISFIIFTQEKVSIRY